MKPAAPARVANAASPPSGTIQGRLSGGIVDNGKPARELLAHLEMAAALRIGLHGLK